MSGAAFERGAALDFPIHSPRQHHGHHFLIRKPRPQRMSERGGAVVLDEKMRKPRERIGRHERRKNERRTPKRNGRREQGPAEQRAERMKDARVGVAVGQHVMRPELGEFTRPLHPAILAQGRSRAIPKENAAVPAPGEARTAARSACARRGDLGRGRAGRSRGVSPSTPPRNERPSRAAAWLGRR